MSIIIPSRDRPQCLVRAIDSLRQTQGAHTPEIVVVLDEPDVESQLAMAQRDDVRVVVVGSEYLGRPQDKYNIGLAHATGDWIVAFADDCTMDNEGWIDAMLQAGTPGGFCGLYDHVHPMWAFCTLVSASREYINRVMHGKLGLPWYHVWWADFEWSDIAKRHGVYVVPEAVSFTHHHAIFGAAQNDEVYRMAAQWREEDQRTYENRQQRRFPYD